MESAPVPLDYAAPESKYSVGNITYSRRQLGNVFFWMLWGDFCLNLMDSGVTPNVVPLQLQKYGASMSAIGFVNGTIVEILSLLMVPIVSTWSDRHRGPLGRRMPFMLYATPPLAVFLVLLGFSPQIATWLKHLMPGLLGGISLASLVIAVIACTQIAYKFFDIFPQSVYYYLFTDVIPQKVMGTFACLFRVCATAGTFVFNLFLLKHAEDHPGAICLAAAVLYMFAFIMLAFMVKEGEYPPPEIPKKGPLLQRAAHAINMYAKESFSIPYYWKYYLFQLCFMCGFRPFNQFLIFYGKDTLKMNLATYGRVMAARDVVQIVVFFLLGPIIDKFHPIRVGLVGYIMMFCAALAGAFLIHGVYTFAALIIITFIAVAVFQGANGALSPRLLPREQYGQFCSANALIWHFGLMIALPLCGKLLDKMGKPFVFVWFLSFSAVGISLMCLLYRDWKRLGGDHNYAPPIKHDPQAAVEALA